MENKNYELKAALKTAIQHISTELILLAIQTLQQEIERRNSKDRPTKSEFMKELERL